MARISGIDLPKNKRVEIALTYIYGIGRSKSAEILQKAGVDFNLKVKDLTESDVAKIKDVIDKNYKVEGVLRQDVTQSIRRLIDINSYRGLRHKKGLPARGQRTRSNARTRKGNTRRPITLKKKESKLATKSS